MGRVGVGLTLRLVFFFFFFFFFAKEAVQGLGYPRTPCIYRYCGSTMPICSGTRGRARRATCGASVIYHDPGLSQILVSWT